MRKIYHIGLGVIVVVGLLGMALLPSFAQEPIICPPTLVTVDCVLYTTALTQFNSAQSVGGAFAWENRLVITAGGSLDLTLGGNFRAVLDGAGQVQAAEVVIENIVYNQSTLLGRAPLIPAKARFIVVGDAVYFGLGATPEELVWFGGNLTASVDRRISRITPQGFFEPLPFMETITHLVNTFIEGQEVAVFQGQLFDTQPVASIATPLELVGNTPREQLIIGLLHSVFDPSYSIAGTAYHTGIFYVDLDTSTIAGMVSYTETRIDLDRILATEELKANFNALVGSQTTATRRITLGIRDYNQPYEIQAPAAWVPLDQPTLNRLTNAGQTSLSSIMATFFLPYLVYPFDASQVVSQATTPTPPGPSLTPSITPTASATLLPTLTPFPSDTPLPTATFTATPEPCIVTAIRLANLRRGPSARWSVREQLPANQAAIAIGQSTDNAEFLWWQLQNGLWVRADGVIETGPCAASDTTP